MISDGLQASLVDVSSSFATLAVMGPQSRDLLASLSDHDLSNEGFPFGSCREITVGGTPVRALRVTYVGELGWELHVATEFALTLFHRISAAGQSHGLVNAGYRAIESLRLEKGYRAWGTDIGPDYTPLEAGLGWAVKLQSDVDFVGRQALVAQIRDPLSRRLALFTVDNPNVILLGRESIYRDDEPVGWLSSGGWGYTVETNIGYGYVRHAEGVTDEYLFAGEYELEVATKRIPCTIHRKALYDPDMHRVTA